MSSISCGLMVPNGAHFSWRDLVGPGQIAASQKLNPKTIISKGLFKVVSCTRSRVLPRPQNVAGQGGRGRGFEWLGRSAPTGDNHHDSNIRNDGRKRSLTVAIRWQTPGL